MKSLSTLTLVGIWFLLLLFLILTVATAYIPMGPFNLVINLGIAMVKALLVILFFMQLRAGSTTVRLVASTGILWLLLLVTLTLADIFTRQPNVSPW